MNRDRNTSKSIAKKSAIRIAVPGIFLILGIGAAVGIQYYRQNMSLYTDMAYSYGKLATANISGDGLNEMIARGDEIAHLYEDWRDLQASTDPKDIEELQKQRQALSELEPDIYQLYVLWENILYFIETGSMTSSDIRYFYVVIPTEEELIYLWDSDEEDGEVTRPMERDAYTPGEKENLMKAYRGEWNNSLAIYHESNGEILGTAMTPIYDGDGKIVAVACVDVSITGIREVFFKLLLNITFVITLILILAGTVYYTFMNREVIAPIVKLNRATSDLVGNLEQGQATPFHVDVHTGDEIEILARSFEEMDQRLRAYIHENAAITAERERIRTELSLATRIQADMLPNIFPPFPDREEFDIYASMHPAKEVGGDFYDFFLIDRDYLGLVIADVSGKGIPAALFMMMSKIMIQNYAMSGLAPHEVLTVVNDQICANNKEQMFVTVWLGILDTCTGKLYASNAGHEYPIVKKPGGPFELIRDRHCFVIGGMKDILYKEYELQLEPGSKLFLYTDGLPEATDQKDELFGTERMMAALNEVGDEAPEKILEHVRSRADAFVGNIPQFDDMTMMCVVWNGPLKTLEEQHALSE